MVAPTELRLEPIDQFEKRELGEVLSRIDSINRDEHALLMGLRDRGAVHVEHDATVEIERKRAEELRQERDKWSGLAEASQRQLVDLTTKRPREGWLRGA